MIVDVKIKKNATPLPFSKTALTTHAQELKSFYLHELFAHDRTRAEKMQIHCDDLTLDFSRQRVNQDTLNIFERLAIEKQLPEKISALMMGEIMNVSESRPALHTALRDFSPSPIFVDGKNIKPLIAESLKKMQQLCEELWQRGIKDVLVIGIGGSYWGSHTVCEALQILPQRLRLHFLADIEEEAFLINTAQLLPEQTAILVISKSFTTSEVLCNAKRARDWLGVFFDRNCIAVTAAVQKAENFGFKSDHILEFWSWVGGRYSVWSTVGMPIALCYGMEVFYALLEGAYQMDQHVTSAPITNNLPMIAALISFLNTRYFDTPTTAIIPYSFRLHAFIPYLQQLLMESLGKCHDLYGEDILEPTGAIIWGQTGLHAQHTFNQLLHQGNHCIAIDFILPHDKPELVKACYAQSHVLTLGDLEHPLTYARIRGNQPHNILKLSSINPKNMGLLMAFYEHKTFLLSCLFNVNPFDQFGIECVKRLGLIL